MHVVKCDMLGSSSIYTADALCMQAQAHYPLVDVFAVSSYLDDLATECRARIATSGAHTDLERLAVLNQLMFSPPAGGRCVSYVIAVTQPTVCTVHSRRQVMVGTITAWCSCKLTLAGTHS